MNHWKFYDHNAEQIWLPFYSRFNWLQHLAPFQCLIYIVFAVLYFVCFHYLIAINIYSLRIKKITKISFLKKSISCFWTLLKQWKKFWQIFEINLLKNLPTFVKECIVDYPWSTWDECTQSCGTGKRTRFRLCSEGVNGNICENPTRQEESCNEQVK